ncbi:coproporphyrinogen III oxidase-like protein [Basidiobolus meristosporus CBS 931.73]|uniref:coproporphyrinogen oxidase n=1 Tax=Basidiobolus meristosporus CBS 931.73 TaxID=1314790 RepID=A0A1Y1XX07_9FUNG|nr:coproporphyrinogen III oxidase-like protein [Basidiobolus meristosporus CBS 931.73]|eukprot:ORX90280.1 coproporphyrinogen III oxidase-like protein [Basidiobolus meristosporus CBS 931.73]
MFRAGLHTRPNIVKSGISIPATIAAIALGAGVGYYQLNRVSYSEQQKAPGATSVKGEALPTYEELLPNVEVSEHSPMRERMSNYIHTLQYNIVKKLSEIDGKPFLVDKWTRPSGGGGVTCVIQDGNVFEKGGVNISLITGTLADGTVRNMRSRGKELKGDGPFHYFAAGLSLVLHPHNPMAPTVHLNYRYFEVNDEKGQLICSWFGGGSDLTPSYLFEEDATHFHNVLKSTCEKHDPEYYPRFKKWCDEYFYLPHRGESRGIGGIFFDDLASANQNQTFSFLRDCGDSFLDAYVPILERRKDMAFTEENKRWQQLRRGRYVEFNLVHDRGTKFGLLNHGTRIESILMSLPLTARWEYEHKPEPNSREQELLDTLKATKEWV